MHVQDQEVSASELGKYTVKEDIAEGTFGKVRMAIHNVTGHKVAMKYIRKDSITKEDTRNRVQREVDYMRVLRHPHIVKLYEVISTQTDIIIVLEYAGGELFNYIVTNGRMPENLARRFFQQLMSAVNYSHHLHIVHRDLKPENILLDDNLNVKLADYGLSNLMSEGEFMKTSCGSPNYAAPEVIRGGFYTGPEIDVWSAGVILYVMLCGRLPFEDDNVQALFQKISLGQFHIPPYLSTEAKHLLQGMLTVDPVKRATVPDVLNSTFYQKDLPRYLTPLPTPRPPTLGTLSSLVAPPKKLDFEVIEGLGRMEESIVEELASMLHGVDKEEIWQALRRDDGIHQNSVKVAYTLLRDKSRLHRNLAEYEEQERDAQLAALDPSNPLSPLALSPGGGEESEENVFENEFGEPEEMDSEDSLESYPSSNNFTILNTSLPGYKPVEDGSSPHHLTSYVSAKSRSSPMPVPKEKKPHKVRWHFGIRSRSPPMEVMLEIYRTLNALGMEFKEKKTLGGLGGYDPKMPPEKQKIERVQDWLDTTGSRPAVDLKAAAGIYFVETRIRIQNVVVLMNLQLYQVDDVNYLVDFHHKRSYKASTEKGAGKYDMAYPRSKPSPDAEHPENGRQRGKEQVEEGDYDVVSPFIFMDVACKLILELAGGGE
ncbi:snf 1 [Sistotremastrum niveocremeum HHB9708]|uniref:non-specific serine/threonine protein kinase n=2 Tax=Sistotremastraceae TaxID=3402574 RepID=A0A164UFD7_9AGAM|nr:snf 1 [Sistotremastrum niveocremeum HHB9708]KZT42606.1 Pkinase-domain-containing protein [Sistotremastrum suecicum HHB10207 ss-3]